MGVSARASRGFDRRDFKERTHTLLAAQARWQARCAAPADMVAFKRAAHQHSNAQRAESLVQFHRTPAVCFDRIKLDRKRRFD
jgi:hypothetical protein